jgi:hypothetical protein
MLKAYGKLLTIRPKWARSPPLPQPSFVAAHFGLLPIYPVAYPIHQLQSETSIPSDVENGLASYNPELIRLGKGMTVMAVEKQYQV